MNAYDGPGRVGRRADSGVGKSEKEEDEEVRAYQHPAHNNRNMQILGFPTGDSFEEKLLKKVLRITC